MKILTFIFLLISLGCKNERDLKLTEKEMNFKNYYSSIRHTSIYNNGIVIILQNQNCSSCRLNTFEKLATILLKNNLQKTIIITKTDSALISIINKIPNSNLLIDSSNQLKDYGLNYAADLFFLYHNSKLTECFEISNDNLINFTHMQ